MSKITDSTAEDFDGMAPPVRGPLNPLIPAPAQQDAVLVWDDSTPRVTHAEALRRLICKWADIAVRHARVEPIEDPDCLIASIAGIRGPWGIGQTDAEARAQLHSVLIDWVELKLEDGDRDIPDMEGIRLVVDS